MPLPLIPIAIISLAGAAYGANKIRTPKEPSAQDLANRAIIYDTALNTCKDSAKLRTLADAFEKQGCKAEAKGLRNRAALRDALPEVKAARKESLAKGMASTNVPGILNLASAFEEIGATAAATELRARAADLENMANPGIRQNTEEEGNHGR